MATKRRNVPIRQFDGISKLNRFSILDTQSPDMENFTSSEYPAMKTRSGFTLYGSALAGKILGLASYKDTELHSIANGEWRRYTAGAWSAAISSGISTTSPASFTNFDGAYSTINLMMANGSVMRRWDGATVTNIASPPANPNYIEQFADRVWCMSGNELHASAYRDGSAWNTVTVPQSDTDSWWANIETPTGETVTALKAGLAKLTAFKPNSIHELYGYAPSDYNIRTATLEVGAINNQSVVSIRGKLYFVHHTGIYEYGGGSLPDRRFSLPVQYFIDNMNNAARSTVCCGTDGKSLYVGIPINSSTAPDTILEYNFDYGIWNVWKGFTPLYFARLGQEWFQGLNDGKVIKMGTSTDNGSAITFKWVTKPFGAGSYSQLITWYRIHLVLYLPSGSSLSVYTSKKDQGDDDWVLNQSLAVSEDVQSARVIFSPGIAANGNWLRAKFEGSGPVTIHEWLRDEEEMPLV